MPGASCRPVTPETTRLLQHWRHHSFSSVRPFFCQVEAIETVIWLTEVAPHTTPGRRVLTYLKAASENANADLQRLALKLATGAGMAGALALPIGGDAAATLSLYRRSEGGWSAADVQDARGFAVRLRDLIVVAFARSGAVPGARSGGRFGGLRA